MPAATLQSGGSLVVEDPRQFLNPYVQIGDFSTTSQIAIVDSATASAVSGSADAPVSDVLSRDIAASLPSSQSVAEFDRWRDQLFAWHSASNVAGSTNVVLLDSNLADSLSLAYAAGAGTQVFGYDSRTQSANQVLSTVISWAHETGVQIGSLAVFSHGSAGQFALGRDWISADTLPETSAAWSQLAGVMAQDANIEIYSCDVAATPAGDDLLNQLALLTGAEVYASTDITGAGGDWTLEASSHDAPAFVGIPAFLDKQRLLTYQFSLANPVANNDTYNVSEDSTITVGSSTANLANWFKFDEGSGQTVTGSGSAGNSGTLGSTSGTDASDPTWSAGYIGGNGLSFDGVDDFVQTNSTVAKTSNDFTLSAWFQTNTTTSQHHILWEGFAGGDGNGNPTPADLNSSEMNLSVGTYNTANKIVFFLGYDLPENGADSIHIVSTDDFTDTAAWHHVAVTVTDLGGGVFSASLYVDGKFQGSDTGSQTDRSQWGALRVGRPGAATRFFDGQIDEVRVYDAALTATQVEQIAQTGVLQNDTDPQNLQIQVDTALVVGPSNGTLTINPDGSFTYTPNSDFYGTDSFTYVATDGTSASSPATVTINVVPVNDAPSITVPGAQSVNKNTSLVFSTGNGNPISVSDIDAANGQILITLSAANGKLTLGSTSGLTFNSGDGSADASMQFRGTLANVNAALQGLSFAPNAGYFGGAGVSIVVSDQGNTGGGALTDSAGVSITVVNTNTSPDANDDSYSTNQNTTLNVSAPGILGNDTDVDGDTLNAILVNGPAHGSLTLNADGSFSYTPTAGYFGSDSFTYRAHDGTASSNLATVSLTINFVNTPPVAANDSYSTNEDTPLVVSAPGILGNDTDVDPQTLTAALVSGPSNGSLSLNANGSFTYTPNANFNGVDSFTYRANDGTANSNLATVQITVNPVNDAPVASNDSYSVAEDGTLSVPANGVLANDTDVDANPLAAALVSGPLNGSLTLNANGSFVYTPNANYHGADSFTYRTNDGTANSNVATVSLTITSVNDAPVAANDAYSTNEDAPLAIPASGVLGNDSDADGDSLTAVLVAGPANGSVTLNADGSFLYTPNANFNGIDSFTYRANDGVANSNLATVQITVNAVNDTPIAVDDSYTVAEDGTLSVPANGVLTNDNDVDADPLTAVLAIGPTHGSLTLNADGSFVYTPDPNYHGADSFTYRVNDGSANSNIATVSLTVTSVNDVPVAANDAYSTNEDTPLTIPASGVLGNDSDADGDSLTAVLVAGPTNGSVTLNPDGSFVYTPNANFNGVDSFTYRANDGAANSNVATVQITVNPVNDAPVAVNDSYSMAEDGVLTVPAAGVLANDTDADGDSLTASLVAGPTHGSLTFNADGSFVYTPNADYNGSDSFTYVATDGTLNSNVATVVFTISNVNDPPVALNDVYATNEDSALNVPASGVLVNDSDVDGDPLTAVLVTGPSNGSLTLNADGSFVYTPNANFNGADSFTYRANDGLADSNVATVQITVNAVNDAPVATDDAYSMNEDAVLVIGPTGVLGNDFDIDGNPLTAIVAAGPSHGALTLNADGSFTYTPNANYHGGDSFTYIANDGALNSNVAVVTITIASVNDAPVAADDTYSVNEDGVLSVAAPGLLVNDSDVDGDPLSVTLATGPANGAVTLNSDGSFVYTPAANFNGVDTFQYRATDGALNSFVATVTIYVDPVNDAPTAGDVQAATSAGTQLRFTRANLIANSYDVDGDPLTVVIEQAPAHGRLIFMADGSFQYLPDQGYVGFDSFLFRVSDGTTVSNAASVVIQVKADGLTAVPPIAPPPGYQASPLPDVERRPGSADGSLPLGYAQPPLRDSGGVGGGETSSGAGASSGKPEIATSETASETTGDQVAGSPNARPATTDPAATDPVRRLGFSASSGFEAAPPAVAFVPALMTGSPIAGVFLVPEPLRKELNRVSEDVKQQQAARQAEVWIVSGVAWSATAGYLVWNLRTFAVFATAALTARPLWKQFDPLSVLDGKDDEDEMGKLFD